MILYGIALENTEYGESDLIYRSNIPILVCSTHSESVSSASDSEHESTSYASSSLGHLPPPPNMRKVQV